jgi:hypothetical protein
MLRRFTGVSVDRAVSGHAFRLGPEPGASPASPRADDSAIKKPARSDATRADEFTVISCRLARNGSIFGRAR